MQENALVRYGACGDCNSSLSADSDGMDAMRRVELSLMLTRARCIVRADVIDEDCGQRLAAEVLREAPELIMHLRTQQRVTRGRYTAAVQNGAHPLEQILSQSAMFDLCTRINSRGPKATARRSSQCGQLRFSAQHKDSQHSNARV